MTYTYQCSECGHQFDIIQKISDGPITQCEKCAGYVSKIISQPSSFILKGSGWFADGYSKEKKSE